jgi:SAM-dependent methyltransferase
MPSTDYLGVLLDTYYPQDYFALFRAHELYNVEPFIQQMEEPILDLGCGNGLIAKLLFNKVLDIGLDPNPAPLRAAQRSGAYRHIIQADSRQMPLPASCVRGVFSNCVLEHIPNLQQALAEVSRLLQPGGLFIATCMAPPYYDLNPIFKRLDRPLTAGLRERMIRAEDTLFNHVSVFSPQEYENMLQNVGMELEHQQYYAPPDLTAAYSVPHTLSKYSYPWQTHLTHRGLLVRISRAVNKVRDRQRVIEQSWQRYHAVCYQRPPEVNHTTGTAQIIIARKPR